MATVHTLRLAFDRIAEHAERNGSSLMPMITTDLATARILVECLAEDLGALPQDLIPIDREAGVYGMYAGVIIVAREPEVCKRPVDDWREHFGALAEILVAEILEA